MKKETTYRVRALGVSSGANGVRNELACDRSFDGGAYAFHHARGATEEDVAAWFRMSEVRDFEIARLETITCGPTELALRRDDTPGAPCKYTRTIIDTRETIVRPWRDSGCHARWLRLMKQDGEI